MQTVSRKLYETRDNDLSHSKKLQIDEINDEAHKRIMETIRIFTPLDVKGVD